MKRDNTVGRQTNSKSDLAYIAGFFDGDGSLMVQFKNRRDRPKGWRIMFTLCFYQDTRHEKPLFWIRRRLGIGYISRRNDGITELRINGYERAKDILENLYPYIRFKRKQAQITLKILNIVVGKKFQEIRRKIRLRIADMIYEMRSYQYQSGWKKKSISHKELRKRLGF